MKDKVHAEVALEAFRFGATKLGLVIKLFWLPVVIVIAIEVLYLFVLLGDLNVLIESDGVIDTRVMIGPVDYAVTYLLAILIFFLYAPGMVALNRIIAGEMEPPGGIAYFRFTSRELRFALGSLLLFAVYLLVFLAIPFALSLTSDYGLPLDPALSQQWRMSGTEFLILLGIAVPYIWFSIRMVPFLPMISIENRFAPGVAFLLSAGNFWRILGVYIIVILGLLASYIGFGLGIVLVSFAVLLPMSALSASTGGPDVVFSILLFVLLIAAYVAFIAFVFGTWQYVQAKVYLDVTRTKREQAMIDKLDDTPKETKEEAEEVGKPDDADAPEEASPA